VSADAAAKTILIVEDNAKNMKLVRDLLQHHGHRTLEADTGEGGLALVFSARPDLVLMDIQLPDIDGTTVLARIREDPSLDAMPVLAVSASVMPDEQQRIVRSGFDGFIAKPISIRPFLAAVLKALTEGRVDAGS
jgi:two-component system cell cycle response regulator DivK